jgi:alpha/beta superfamily hydrolase
MDPAVRVDVQREHTRAWTWAVILGAFAAWIVGTTAGVIPGFITPPAIFGGGEDSLRVDEDRFPPRTELVELPLRTGEILRGVYVPSDPGAPVVLHLLESSGSVSSKNGYRHVLADLADSGFASLMIDYRGVGASDGYRSPKHLEEDAWAVWEEAVRRAGGDPSLVVVRTISIGALAAASLVKRGVRPAAWILIAPVRAETVVANFAQWQYPGLLSRLASRFFRPPTSVDLVEAVTHMGPHLWVYSPEHDTLILPDEQAMLSNAVTRTGGVWGRDIRQLAGAPESDRLRRVVAASFQPREFPKVERSGVEPQNVDSSKHVTETHFTFLFDDHVFTSMRAHDLFVPEERDLLASTFPCWPDGEACALAILSGLPDAFTYRFPRGSDARLRLKILASRLRSVRAPLVAAAALRLEDATTAERILRIDRWGRPTWLCDLELDDLLAVFDLDDPAGRLPESALLDWVRTFSTARAFEETACLLAPSRVLELARSSEAEFDSGVELRHELILPKQVLWMQYPCAALWRSLIIDRQLSRSDARRQATRILLKAAGIPDRVVTESGTTGLQLRDRGSWIPVELDGPAPVETPEPPGVTATSPR